VSQPSSGKSGSKRPIISESPFQRFTARTEEIRRVSLKDAYMVKLDQIELNPNQPRKHIDPNSLAELSADIKARGILQPPIVRPIEGNSKYQLVVGERRYRAAQMAELTEIPVLVKSLDDKEAQIVSLIENIQREDLSFADEANYFKILQQEYELSIRGIAELVHKSKSYVETRLNLLKNPELLAAVQAQKIGLHEATVLARLDKQGSIESVREKDTSTLANKGVREKDTSYDELSPGVRPFIRVCRNLAELSYGMSAKLQRVSESERATIVETLDELAEELGKLRQKMLKDL
jgi:ParB family chromosome partitioning protein